MAVVTMRQLLESGVHFGHQTRRWNPKMKRFIFTERNGIYIVDLQQSLSYIDRAYEFVKETVSHGGTILFVGTKKQAQEPVAEQASRVGMPYVNQRWLGGMLTNFATVNKRLQRLKELEEIDFEDVAGSAYTKKELLIMRRERDKLAKTLGGIRDMVKVPSAVWVVDTNKEHLAVDEARKLGIPVVAILDTNCDPDLVDYQIPGNDDAIRSVTLLTRVVADAVAEGLIARHSGRSAEAGAESVEAEPLAEWERELLAGAGDASEGAAVQTEPKAGEPKSADTETSSAAPAAKSAEDDLPADARAAQAEVDSPVEAIGTSDTAPGDAAATSAPAASVSGAASAIEPDADAAAEAATAEPTAEPTGEPTAEPAGEPDAKADEKAKDASAS